MEWPKLFKSKVVSKLWYLPLLIVVFYLGYMFNGHKDPAQKAAPPLHNTQHRKAGETSAETKPQIWTCSMHPQIRLPNPGKCPICGMDLIPVSTAGQDHAGGLREITLSEQARKLADIQTQPVRRPSMRTKMEIRLPGKVDYDETRVGYITAWVPGRIERMYVNFTGTVVKKDEPMVEIYSPELFTAQEELFQAKKAVEDLVDSDLESMKVMARDTVDAVREKLRLLGLTESQIAEIESRETPRETITIYAPMSGVVIRKDVSEGMYVKTGSQIYTIADLSTVWVMLDAYESDLASIRVGQKVTFETEAYPGQPFHGTVKFIHPTLDKVTRTAKIHVIVPNKKGQLLPEMLVTSVIQADLSKKEAPLLIPASAPLITGKRAVVYVAVPGQEGTFEGREIVLGPRAGDYYVVREGLREGESVVTYGNFKIDSALQIMAKPSMMNPEDGGPSPGHQHGGSATRKAASSAGQAQHAFQVPQAFEQSLTGLFTSYFNIHHGLSRDNLLESQKGADGLVKALGSVNMGLLKEEDHSVWMKAVDEMSRECRIIQEADDIAVARRALSPLSEALIKVARQFGTGDIKEVFLFHCPMANNNRGADWLQNRENVENPYYGSSMFTCGEKTEDLKTEDR